MATNTKTSPRRRTSSGLARLWGLRALIAAAIGVAIGAGAGVMTVNKLEPGRTDSVDSLAVMLDSISKGRIPDAKPAGTPTADAAPAAPDRASLEPELVSVPAVTDLEEGDARNAILDAGLQVGEVQFRPSIKPAGIVLGTFPVSGARVPTKSAISLVLSDGRDPADTLQQHSLR